MSDTPVVMKYDAEKNRLELLPTSLLTEVGKVLTYGAKKYRDRGWEAGMDWSRVYGATLRHLTAFWNGEDLDPETGLPHLAHAACEVAFLLEYMTTHPELDNRPKNRPKISVNKAAWRDGGNAYSPPGTFGQINHHDDLP